MTASTVARHFAAALARAEAPAHPFRHWLLRDALPADRAAALRDLPIPTPRIDDTLGRRETNNATRSYFSADNRAKFPVCADVASAFQDPEVTRAIARTCGLRLEGGLLRIEYCQDTEGFWLEPHTDIGAKLFTLLIYLSDGPGASDWGTDLYDKDLHYVGRAPSAFNSGLIFVPGADTWHGFEPRPIRGVRRSLIVNYVKSEWRDRAQLCFPDRPIAA